MNTIGERIAQLRKEKGMTQDVFATTIGVSAQSVSKWENNTTMPDIMLLPVISDIFGVTIDSLFGKNAQNTTATTFDDLPEEAFDTLLRTMQCAWNNTEQSSYSIITPEAGAEETKNHLTKHPNSQTAIYSDKGGAVYANRELGLIFRKAEGKLTDLLHNDSAAEMLSTLNDMTVRKIMEYQFCNSGVAFTAASVATKLGIETSDTEKSLGKLVKFAFTSCREVDTGDSKIQIYGVYGGHKMLLVYSILRLAARLADYQENYRGFRGVPDQLLC